MGVQIVSNGNNNNNNNSNQTAQYNNSFNNNNSQSYNTNAHQTNGNRFPSTKSQNNPSQNKKLEEDRLEASAVEGLLCLKSGTRQKTGNSFSSNNNNNNDLNNNLNGQIHSTTHVPNGISKTHNRLQSQGLPTLPNLTDSDENITDTINAITNGYIVSDNEKLDNNNGYCSSNNIDGICQELPESNYGDLCDLEEDEEESEFYC